MFSHNFIGDSRTCVRNSSVHTHGHRRRRRFKYIFFLKSPENLLFSYSSLSWDAEHLFAARARRHKTLRLMK